MATTKAVEGLAPGVYWLVSSSDETMICEKRAGEHFVRFTNGARRSWSHEGERFVGPLEAPSAADLDVEHERHRSC